MSACDAGALAEKTGSTQPNAALEADLRPVVVRTTRVLVFTKFAASAFLDISV